MFSGSVTPSSGGPFPPKSSGPRMPPIVATLSLVLHVSVVLMALSIAFLCFDNTLFAWHPLFMSVGYLLFMTEGLLSAVMFRHVDGPERVSAIYSHAMMQLRALVCIAIGFGVIYRNKAIHDKPHFMSTHGKVGLATLLLTILAPLGGAFSFRRFGLIQRLPEVWQPRMKWMHKRLGVFTWILALVAIELALPHPAVNKGLITRVWQVGVAFIGAVMMAIMYRSQVKQKGDGEDSSCKAV